MGINKLEFGKFCNAQEISFCKREVAYKELEEIRQWYLENKDSLSADTAANSTVSPSETFLIQNILDTYAKVKDIDPTENPPAYHNFRADKRYIFYRDALVLMGIKVKSLSNHFLTFFELIEGSTFRYKSLQCDSCKSRKVVKAGLNMAGNQRYKCSKCGSYVKRELNPKFVARYSLHCPYTDCESSKIHKYGFSKENQRYKCMECQRTFIP